MSDSLLSSSWYRVAQLKPRRSGPTQLHRHHYRGQRWYVLQNQATGRCQLLTPSAHLLIGLMDGKRTTQEIWDEAARQLGDDGPTQDETIRLLGMLYFADSLSCDVSPDTAETFRRCQRRDASEKRRRMLQPLSLRLPLFDPDAFLGRWVGFVRPLFSVYGALAWCVVVGAALVLGASHWTELTQDAGSRLLSGQSLLLLWIAYPCVKALHELGHGFAAKVWGAEVHEMGIMFLVLMPVPYVDASAANVFPDKRKRMVVSAAGILVEMLLAALALLVWLAVEPGFVRSVAYSVIWISGASTLLFNANPLLRFDGYFVLSDWIEIPNLGARSNQYLGYLVQRVSRLSGAAKCVRAEPGPLPGQRARGDPLVFRVRHRGLRVPGAHRLRNRIVHRGQVLHPRGPSCASLAVDAGDGPHAAPRLQRVDRSALRREPRAHRRDFTGDDPGPRGGPAAAAGPSLHHRAGRRMAAGARPGTSGGGRIRDTGSGRFERECTGR
jgi:putative peptide zinc metalloprotease protein